MSVETSLSEQSLRLMSAYQKMNFEDRDALDRLMGQLAEVHRAVSDLLTHRGLERQAEDETRRS
jgi:hypothetical protein